MRHQKRKFTLDRATGPRKALLRTLAVSLILHDRIQTTPARARALQQMVEPLITRGKQKNVHTIRLLEQRLASKQAALRVVNTIGPRFQSRNGGYTRLVAVRSRKGDNASQAILEWV